MSAYGYQAQALQATYTAAKIYAVKFSYVGGALTYTQSRVFHLFANSAGTWANSTAATGAGLFVRVGPGSAPGTRKLLISYNTQLVETLDNLVVNDSTSPQYLPTFVNTNSYYITVGYSGLGTDSLVSPAVLPANTLDGWNITTLGGAVNVSGFVGGDNGANTESLDYVGELDPVSDNYTGIRSFLHLQDVTLNVLAVPGVIDNDVQQNLVLVAKAINSYAVLDVDQNTVPRQYADWRNATGPYSYRVKIDDWHGGLLANWFNEVDPFTADTRLVPPTVGKLRALARTWNNGQIWDAAAGEIRGYIDNATGLQYRNINIGSKTTAYQSNVNLILSNQGRIQVYGDRTLQVADSKLSMEHVAFLTNYIVQGFGQIARRHIFDPNDPVLLSQLFTEGTQFLDGIANNRGFDGPYKLVIDSSNNTAATRNQRQVNMSLGIIPVGVAEVFNLALTVNASGAQLLS
jgi:hypothetical protein